ncbi:MAG TPA: hypothetical protein VKU00_06925 [Chthonomonadaceae bacterium]|nr:hypothetical protein [Chthonomonadaceae bacterium]
MAKATEARGESPDQIVEEALRFSLQPLRQEALQRLNMQIRKQQNQSGTEIRTYVASHLTTAEQEWLPQLLERNRTEGLTPEQKAEMQQIFDRIEVVATEKAAAIWLLSGKSSEPRR